MKIISKYQNGKESTILLYEKMFRGSNPKRGVEWVIEL